MPRLCSAVRYPQGEGLVNKILRILLHRIILGLKVEVSMRKGSAASNISSVASWTRIILVGFVPVQQLS
jgi:hypothetical protein